MTHLALCHVLVAHKLFAVAQVFISAPVKMIKYFTKNQRWEKSPKTESREFKELCAKLICLHLTINT